MSVTLSQTSHKIIGYDSLHISYMLQFCPAFKKFHKLLLHYLCLKYKQYKMFDYKETKQKQPQYEICGWHLYNCFNNINIFVKSLKIAI